MDDAEEQAVGIISGGRVRALRDAGLTVVRAGELVALRARVAELEDLVRRMMEAAEVFDGIEGSEDVDRLRAVADRCRTALAAEGK